MPITVVRLSDNKKFTVANANENTKVGELKEILKTKQHLNVQ